MVGNRGFQPFRWTESTGAQRLQPLRVDAILAAGCDVTQRTLSSVWDISADGQTIAGGGDGSGPQFGGQVLFVWIAEIPEPGATS